MFRDTFLGPVFFTLFPSQVLLRKPKLNHSSTLLTWLRLAYPIFKDQLTIAVEKARNDMIQAELSLIREIRFDNIRIAKKNPIRTVYIHLLNLQTLFEFCIPIIQDYGSSLKSNDYLQFVRCYGRLLLFFLCCGSKGGQIYDRCMYIFSILLRYWHQHQFPFLDLLQFNHTIFSEESGEIALSLLARGTPTASRTKLSDVRYRWQMLKLQFESHVETAPPTASEKKYRQIGTFSSFIFVLPFFRLCSSTKNIYIYICF